MKEKIIEKVYRVDAESITDCYIYLVAESINDAFQKAKDVDGGMWIEDNKGGEWKVNDSRLLELPIYLNGKPSGMMGDNEQTISCPNCGNRTEFDMVENSDIQVHTCLSQSCKFKFVMEFDED